jgi:uncharacterized protein (TIGR03083 family)
MSQREAHALMSTLSEVSPSAPTACVGWSAHHIVAHLAAGSKEIADLIEERLAGRPTRPTQLFEDREPRFRALADDELRAAWMRHAQRKGEALAELGDDNTFEFTGMSMTAAQIAMHSRSEAAIHRWDIAGSDAISDELLGQPELTAHAVSVLNAMPILNEAGQKRMQHGGGRLPLSIVLSAVGQPDVVFSADSRGTARFDLVDEGTGVGDAVMRTDPAHRLLVLWGRRSTKRQITIEADEATSQAASSILWPSALRWC